MTNKDMELLEQENFKYSETLNWGAVVYSQELVSPENDDCSCKIEVYFDGDEWCATVTNYFGRNKFYDGQEYHRFKSLKVLMNRLHKDYNFMDFNWRR